MNKKYLIPIFLISISMFAQTYTFTNYNTENSGIGFNSIDDIKIDNNGILWIASYYNNGGNGIAKFDGTNWTNYNVSNSNIIDNKIIDIEIDNLNKKWLASWQNGIISFDGTNWTNFNTSNSQIPTNSINDIAIDNSNNIWIASNQGLTKFDGTNWITYNLSNSSLTTNQINSVAIDNNNVLWLTTGNPFSNSQLISFTNNIWTLYNYANGIGRILKIDSNNTIYVNSYWGFSKFENQIWTQYQFNYTNSPTCLLGCQVEAIEKNLNGDIFAGLFYECTSGGLQNFSSCTSFNSFLPNNFGNITEIKRDNNNNIWVGALSGGLLKMTPNNLGLNISEKSKKSILYPNPTKDDFTITNSENSFFTFNIYDLTGKLLINGKSEHNKSININQLNRGNYLVKVTDENNLTETFKLIKK
jgi:hypothetical protein